MDLEPRSHARQVQLPIAPAFVAVLVSTRPAVIEWVAQALSAHFKSLELNVVSCLTSLATYPAQTPVRCLMFESAEGFEDSFAMLCAYHLETSVPISTLLIKEECSSEDRLRALALGAEDILDLSPESQRTLPLLVGRTALVSSTQSHLERNEREFRAYLDESPDAVAAFNEEGAVYANPRFRQLLESVGRKGALVRSLNGIFPNDVAKSAIERLRDEGAVPAFDVRIGSRSDPATDMTSDVIVSARLRWAHFEGQRTMLLALTDVTNQRRQQALQKLHALGQTAAGVAHDFNNFLSAIIGRIGLLRRLVSDPEAVRNIDVIEQAATDASQVVARMKTLSRPAEDVPRMQVDLASIARDALEMVRPRFAAHYQVIEELNDQGLIRGDATELREVLVNLINNALDAMPTGGALKVVTRTTDNGAFVTVADTGSGMSDEVKARALEPFFTTKGKAGTGLGLALSHAIVRRHGGSLQIQSSEGQGTHITLRFSRL